MIKTDQTVSRHVRLSAQLSVDLTFSVTGCTCEWDPKLRPLTKAEERRYFKARNECASELARLIDGTVMVQDVTSDGLGVSGMLLFTPDGRVERV